MDVMGARMLLAALGGTVIASGFLLDVDNLLKIIQITLGLFLIHQARYYLYSTEQEDT